MYWAADQPQKKIKASRLQVAKPKESCSRFPIIARFQQQGLIRETSDAMWCDVEPCPRGGQSYNCDIRERKLRKGGWD